MTTDIEASPGITRSLPDPGRPSIPKEDLDRLVSYRHHDPHSILGAHPFGQGVVIRAFRPQAARVVLLLENGGGDRVMTKIHDAGLFETVLPEAKLPLRYRFEVHYGNNETYTLRDPYCFLPSIGELDLHLWGEGRHERAYEKLGAHVRELEGVRGVSFGVWAPGAAGVSVVGDFNGWDGRLHMMRVLGSSGIWELFIPDLGPGSLYKYEIRTQDGNLLFKTDPFAAAMDVPPGTSAVIYQSKYQFGDKPWLEARDKRNPLRGPMSIYEVHLGSWRRVPEEGMRPLTYREIAPMLADYVNEMGFTHIELLPVMEHPFSPSWGYQVSGYFTPTARFGSPDDFRYFVDYLHQRGIGVILDWVPAHFPKDSWSLGRFDGTGLFEHLDPRQGEHPDWGTYIFNFGRNEVRNFLLASAFAWLSDYHADGLRVDAVASMLYLNYSRAEGQWIPNIYGGNENLDAIAFIKELNERVYAAHPGALMVAEESTAWPAVSRPTYSGGLGFGFKWNMGWMHDTLEYFSKDPVYRRFHHHNLTFGFLYAWSENFILPLSHDEVVHGKQALLSKMPGDRWQKFANLRSLYSYMWAHPGKKLLFMGSEFGQWREWKYDESLDWHVLDGTEHRGLQRLVRDLNRLYREEPALWEADVEPSGFQWTDVNNANDNVVAFFRIAPSSGRRVLCAFNFSPVIRKPYRVGVPELGYYREVLNSDAEIYAGSNVGNGGGVNAEPIPWNGFPYSVSLTLPPLAGIWLAKG